MNEHDKKKQEMMEELARRFRDSAHTLKSVARRINQAAQVHDENVRRLDHAGTRLRNCVESKTENVTFTYLEYLEFGTADEFRKFKTLDVITEDEISSVDWESLSQQLLST